ncbi:MAG: GNAT family N-acetyltransferase [Candidatus Promineifilaceae bacterium]
MAIEIYYSEDAGWTLAETADFLAAEPVLNNLILTLLHSRAVSREAGRYWTAEENDQVVGLVYQSPLHFQAQITPMPAEVITAVVNAICDMGAVLPGVSGTAAAAARFAGQWTECMKSAAVPEQGLRLYEIEEVAMPEAVPGRMRLATAADREFLIDWVTYFHREAGLPETDVAVGVDGRLAQEQYLLWEDDEPVSLVGFRSAVERVKRIGPVYTPPVHRRNGYAGVLVGELSQEILDQGNRCVLYTDLANPQSNSIYRRLGYRAVDEVIRYKFL